MTKKAEKKLTLDDFLITTLEDKPTKLMLLRDGEETKEYLEVISSGSKKLKRAKMKYGMEHNKIVAEAQKIDDDVDKNLFYSEEKTESDAEYAAEMVTGWSLGEFSKELLFKLLKDNDILVQAIISHSHNNENYCAKK